MVEVVTDFKLLGCTIDNKLTFQKRFKTLNFTICDKLFAIKNLFFLLLILNYTSLKPSFFLISIISLPYFCIILEKKLIISSNCIIFVYLFFSNLNLNSYLMKPNKNFLSHLTWCLLISFIFYLNSLFKFSL